MILLSVLHLRADGTTFDDTVHPYFQTYCIECHTAEEKKGGMDLSVIRQASDFIAHPTALTHIIDVIDFQDMPPQDAEAQPTEEESADVLAWLQAELQRQRNAAPNDPGIVPAPRLNASEYGYVIRDIFGTTAFDASAFLPPEGGAGEGFTNVGGAQSLGTSQFENYLSAANRVLSHARITPEAGFSWSPAPQGDATTEAQLSKKLVQNWINWHGLNLDHIAESHIRTLRNHTGMYWGAYWERAWIYNNRQSLGLDWNSVEDAAAGMNPELFPEILDNFLAVLQKNREKGQDIRQQLSYPNVQDLIERTREFSSTDRDEIRTFFQETQRWFDEYTHDNRWNTYDNRGGLVNLDKSPEGTYRIWNRAWEGGVANFPVDLEKSKTGNVILSALDLGDGNENDFMIWQKGTFYFEDGSTQPWEEVLPQGLHRSDSTLLPWGSDANGGQLAANQIGVQAPSHIGFKIPEGAHFLELQAVVHPEYKSVGSVMPTVNDQIPEIIRGRAVKGRVLNVGGSPEAKTFDETQKQPHMFFGNFGKHTRIRNRNAFAGINWLNADSAEKLGIPWPQNDKPGFGNFLLEPSSIYAASPASEQAKLAPVKNQLKELILESNPERELVAMQNTIRKIAEKAWRRPLNEHDIEGLTELYQRDRDSGLTYDFAIKTAIKAVLVSPEFLFRVQRAQNSSTPYAIGPEDLADRLAFFLWASIPDESLLEAARTGRLSTAEDLQREARRMLKDPRSRAMASDFAGQWFKFNNFHNFTGPDAEKFSTFTPALSKAMYMESVLFFEELFRENLSIFNIIHSDFTFLNETLAKHYGIPGVKGSEMRRVELPEGSPRGGLITQASVLTKTSAPLRTSQVNRGVWVYEQVLGHHLPPPPPNVPLLSDDETNEDGLTVAQQLAKHREKPECFSCHAKFDALGFALENFDPIGTWRTEIAGRPVENAEPLEDGRIVEGLEGLRTYLYEQKNDVAESFTRKLIGYALGRGLLVTDKPLIDEMVAALQQNEYRPMAAMDVLLASPQFLTRRDEVTNLSQVE